MATDNNVFLSNKNMNMIWEIISDDPLFQNKTNNEMNEINNVFFGIAQQFYDREKMYNQDLINTNKKFISVIMNILKANFSKKDNKQEALEKPKIKKEFITQQDIQANRMNEFERELNRKQSDFTNSMTLPVPEKPTFIDNTIEDIPLTDLDNVIKQAIAQRNYEIQEIASTYPKKPVPLENKVQVMEDSENSENGIKYIKIDKNDLKSDNIKIDIIELNNENKKKNITWANEAELNETITENKNNIHMETETIVEEKEKKPIIDLNNVENLLVSILKEMKIVNTKYDMLYYIMNKISTQIDEKQEDDDEQHQESLLLL